MVDTLTAVLFMETIMIFVTCVVIAIGFFDVLKVG